jgi:hypothetical protein
MKQRRGWTLPVTVVLMVCGIAGAQGQNTITVGATGADFTTIQAAVNAAPDEGAVIKIRPGVYREVVHVDKPKIQLRGGYGRLEEGCAGVWEQCRFEVRDEVFGDAVCDGQ